MTGSPSTIKNGTPDTVKKEDSISKSWRHSEKSAGRHGLQLGASRAWQRATLLLAGVVVMFWIWSGRVPLLRQDQSFSTACAEGGSWLDCLHASLRPTCLPGRRDVKRYVRPNLRKTVLASFPRSGNSYTRSLIEQATGYSTSSVYGDNRLTGAFAGESDGLNSPLLVKAHWPMHRMHPETDTWQQFDQAVRLIRNPIDAFWSYYHLYACPSIRQASRVEASCSDKTQSVTARLSGLNRFGDEHREDLEEYARLYVEHMQYWNTAKLQFLNIRYEDLKGHTLPKLMEILTFLLPKEDLPTLEQVACAISSDPSAYTYRKTPMFDAWDRYDDSTRMWLLEQTREPWCKYGYNILLEQIKGIKSPIDCKEVG